MAGCLWGAWAEEFVAGNSEETAEGVATVAAEPRLADSMTALLAPEMTQTDLSAAPGIAPEVVAVAVAAIVVGLVSVEAAERAEAGEHQTIDWVAWAVLAVVTETAASLELVDTVIGSVKAPALSGAAGMAVRLPAAADPEPVVAPAAEHRP